MRCLDKCGSGFKQLEKNGKSSGLDRQTLLIGLDGASFTVLDHLMENGTMPFLKELISSGCRGELTSIVPPLTPPAWISMVTGCRPGTHGVFNFLQFESPKSRYIKWLSFRDIRRETVWSIVNRHGMRAGGLNFIGMNPPPQVDGYMIPGFVSWRWLKKNSHPQDLFDRLRNISGFDIKEMALNFREEEKAVKGCQKEEYEDWISLHIRRERQWFEVVRYLMKNDPCHLTAMIFDGLDRIQHVCWRFLDPALGGTEEQGFRDLGVRDLGKTASPDPLQPKPLSRPPLLPWEERVRDLCLEYFRNLDGFIEEIVHLAEPEANIFIASDHGFGPTGEIVYINQWLHEHGYLEWKDNMKPSGPALEKPANVEGHSSSRPGSVDGVAANTGPHRQGDLPLSCALSRQADESGGEKVSGHVSKVSGGHVSSVSSRPEDLESLGVESPYRSLLHLDWKRTKAYAATASSNGIIIQVAGKRSEEGIPESEYFSFREELTRKLLNECRDPATGEPLITKVYTREEAFAGDHIDCAPDLTLVLRDSGFISIYPSTVICRPRSQVMGTHCPEGVFAAVGPGIRKGQRLPPLSIIQVAPTMLHSLGIPIPADMEGQVVTEIFEPEFLRTHPVEVGEPTLVKEPYQGAPVQTEDAEGQEQIMLRLKSLGYV